MVHFCKKVHEFTYQTQLFQYDNSLGLHYGLVTAVSCKQPVIHNTDKRLHQRQRIQAFFALAVLRTDFQLGQFQGVGQVAAVGLQYAVAQ